MTTYFVMSDKMAKKYGSDTNSGLSFDSAFKSLSHAICVVEKNRKEEYKNLEKCVCDAIKKMTLPTCFKIDDDFLIVVSGQHESFVYENIIIPNCVGNGSFSRFSIKSFLKQIKDGLVWKEEHD